jgi:hypothetical protein
MHLENLNYRISKITLTYYNEKVADLNSAFYYSEDKNNNRNKVLVKCQMDSKVATDFDTKVSLFSQSTTTFVEDSNVINVGGRTNAGRGTYIETNSDIKSFLAKPVLLKNDSWLVTNPSNYRLHSFDISPLLTAVGLWEEKLRGFNLMRGDFVVKVVINASPFHQGKLLLHYLPCYRHHVVANPGYPKYKDKTLTQKVQHPHVEIDCRTTSVSMRIPYITPSQWFDKKSNEYDWGTVFLDVFSSLVTGPSAPVGENRVDFSIYGYWENFELAAPTVAQMSNRVIRRGGVVPETAENEGPITVGLRKVGRVAGILSEIPVLTAIAQPVEWMSNILSNAASVLGWSKPRELSGVEVMAKTMHRYAGTCDGPDLAVPGGVSCLNRLPTIDYGSYTNEDEMSLEYLYKVPLYNREIQWTTAQNSGALLLQQSINPMLLAYTDTDALGTHTATHEYHAPFTYLAAFHRQWRGCINMTLKFVKTQMHSGRIEVTWVPCNNPTTAPDLGTSAYNKRTIIDLRTEDTVTLELPYLISSDYIPVKQDAYDIGCFSGSVTVRVLNDLRAPESCAQSIAMQVFYTAGDDYELAVPGPNLRGPATYVPQMSNQEMIINTGMSGNEIVNQEIGDKNCGADSLFASARCVGERSFSLKTYLLRNSIINYYGTNFDWNGTSYMFDPYYISAFEMSKPTGALYPASLICDHLTFLAPMFSFMRGGIRMSMYSSTKTSLSTSSVLPSGISTFNTQPWINYVNKNSFTVGLAANSTEENLPLEPANIIEDNNMVYQHIPYYNRYPFQLISYYQGSDSARANKSRSNSTWAIKSSAAFGPSTVLQRAVADDFQLMFFTGCPPLLVNYI